MLDKSIKKWNIVMRLPADKVYLLPEPSLPAGFSLRTYTPGVGDDARWARISASVGEFDSYDEALEYFRRVYLPIEQRLDGLWFVVSPDGDCVAHALSNTLLPEARIDWVACLPEYQGKGLGKAVTLGAMEYHKRRPAADIYLTTQTWSHRAVRMYWNMGFRMLRETNLRESNDYAEAVEQLKTVYTDGLADRLMETSER